MLQGEPNGRAFLADSAGIALRDPGFLERAGLAHELGNLIQVASSAMNIVARHTNVQTDLSLEPVLNGARDSLDRAGLLIRQTLLRAMMAEAEIEAVEVGQCLKDVERVVLYSWPPELSVRLSLQADLPRLRCDALDLHNAVLNLALNARAAMPDGGEIVIAAKTVLDGDGMPSVQISVSDTGMGMSPDTARRACDPFFTTKAGGLGGLGLPIVKRFAEDLGGTITIDSMQGVGTRVILQLPAAG